MPDSLAVTICATEKYQYAMLPQARAIHANLRHLDHPIAIILVGDEGLKPVAEYYEDLFKGAGHVRIERRAGFKERPGDANYKNGAQLLIAQMRTAAFTLARTLGASLCWSFDSDVIPKTALCYRTLRWVLDWPGSFYEVAISPYPSQGGGDQMLTGRGTPERPIMPDYTPEERKIPEDLQKRIDAYKSEIAKIKPGEQPSPELVKEGTEINQKTMECPPVGNVFEVNGKFGWKRRGWLTTAYPGLGRGAIVPTDWCGFGNTLMSARALDEADFFGYDGGGTEDLYVVWQRWHQAGIRIGSALHEPSSHVSRRSDGRYFIAQPRFVTDGDENKGECTGHIRVHHRPFYSHKAGESYDAANDGQQIAPDKRTKAPEPAAAAPAPAAAADPLPALTKEPGS